MGDSKGRANGQSDCGTFIASASGSYLGGDPPSFTSYGFANPYFEDTITLSGGTGSATVKVALQLDGAISTSTVGNGSTLPTVFFTTEGILTQYAQLSLFQTIGDGNITLIDNTTATWASPVGTLTQDNSGSLAKWYVDDDCKPALRPPVTMQTQLGVRDWTL